MSGWRALTRVGDMPPHIEVWCSVRVGGDTKTRKSRRTLTPPPQVVNVLKVPKIDQAKDRLVAGNCDRTPLWCSAPRSVPH
jgi:hypothetical protein